MPEVGNPPGAPPITTGPAGPPAEKPHAPTSGLNLSRLETKDLRVLYFDPSETYLTPYVGRAVENSIAFQKRSTTGRRGTRPRSC